MRVEMPLASGLVVHLIGNPLKLSGTPVTYVKLPPGLGSDIGTVLTRALGLTGPELAALAVAAGVISGDLNT